MYVETTEQPMYGLRLTVNISKPYRSRKIGEGRNGESKPSHVNRRTWFNIMKQTKNEEKGGRRSG